MWIGIVIGAVLVIGLVVYYVERKPYIARKEASLKRSAYDLANQEAAKVTDALKDAANKVV